MVSCFPAQLHLSNFHVTAVREVVDMVTVAEFMDHNWPEMISGDLGQIVTDFQTRPIAKSPTFFECPF